jgi:hypothetical protein
VPVSVAAGRHCSYARPAVAAAASNQTAGLELPDASSLPSFPRRVWLILAGAGAGIMGLLPHVLHHAGPLAGAALFAGVVGSLLFGALGLLVAIPFLRRMYRRFATWRAPAIAVALFAVVFSISTLIVGPRITGGSTAPEASAPPSTAPAGVTEREHERHH